MNVNQSSGRVLKFLMMVNLGLTLFAIALGAGVTRIPWDTPDSHGRIYNFNDPMSFEHFRTAVRSVSIRGLVAEAGVYGGALVVVQFIGIGLLSRRAAGVSWWGRGFFYAQTVLFAGGWLLLLGLPFVLFEAVRTGFDRELFTDGIPVWIFLQTPWVVLSFIAATNWRSFLGTSAETSSIPSPLLNPN